MGTIMGLLGGGLGDLLPYLIGAAGLAMAFLFGRGQGKAKAETKRLKERIEGMERKKERDDEIAKLDDDARLAELNRFMRGKRADG